VFKSEIEEARWRRMNNLRPAKRRDEDAAGGGSIKEVLALMEERESKRREEERERRAEEKKEAAEREERNRKEQRDHEEKLARENAEREERRRRDDAERDERRRAQHREDIDRVQAAAAAQLAQTQQFFTQLQAIQKHDARAAGDTDPVKLLTAGMELALKLRGDGGGGGAAEPADALTALLSRLPETLAEVRSTAKEAYNEIKGKKGAEPAALEPVPVDGDSRDEVTVTGTTARKLKAMIGILQSAKKDPEKVLTDLADHVIGLAKRPATKAPARPPATRAATKKPARKVAARPAARPPAPKRQTKKAST